MMYRIALFVVLIAKVGHGQADTLLADTTSWDDNYAYSGKPKKWKVLLEFDARRSFFSGQPVKINGLRIGAELRGIHRFGLGFYGLSRNLIFRDIKVNRPDATDTTLLSFNVGYAGLFYERVVYATRRWEFAVPVMFGGGTVSASYSDTANVFRPLLDRPFSLLTPGIGIRFKPIRWLSLGTGVGYRLVFDASREVRESFTGFYYKYGVSILFGELYRMIFKKDEYVGG